MTTATDFESDSWLDPAMFVGLAGVACTVRGGYSSLFREDGFAKTAGEILKYDWVREYVDRELRRRVALCKDDAEEIT